MNLIVLSFTWQLAAAADGQDLAKLHAFTAWEQLILGYGPRFHTDKLLVLKIVGDST